MSDVTIESEMKRVKHCIGCKYLCKVGVLRNCDYFLMTGNRRPCPAGKGCTVKDDGKRPKRSLCVNKKKAAEKEVIKYEKRIDGDDSTYRTKVNVEKMCELFKAGYTPTQIGKQMGLSRNTVNGYAHYHKWIEKFGDEVYANRAKLKEKNDDSRRTD